jgi:hypothetical protein
LKGCGQVIVLEVVGIAEDLHRVGGMVAQDGLQEIPNRMAAQVA